MDLLPPHSTIFRSPTPFSSFISPLTIPRESHKRPKAPPATPVFLARLAKNRNIETSKGLQKNSQQKLSHILRTDAAVKNIEKKANASSAGSFNLWPKAVLEALEDSISRNQWESALKIFALLRKQHWYFPKCQTYARLLTMLGKCRQPKQANSLFQIMLSEGLKPTLDVYTSLVGVYGLSGLFYEAFHTIEEMKSVLDCKPDAYTYTILINSCCKLRRFDLISRILDDMSYSGVDCNTVTYNTIVDGYGKVGLFEEMENSLFSMLESGHCLPDVFTLNSFLWAYGNGGEIDKVEKWYDEFQHMGVSPDMKTFNILIKSYGKAGMFEKMNSVMDFIKKRFFSPTIVTYNIIIEIYGKADNIQKMEYFFQLMKNQGVKPNYITYCSLISAYKKAGSLKRVGSILRQVLNSDVALDTPFFNCIMSAYGQAGEMQRMEEIFLSMKEWKCKPDNVTFSTMIHAYSNQGMVEAAQELELKMSGTG